ncbi:LysR family transcriptional regulator [Falsiroseomonas oryzae]|uniref:LysR family transcriptional regulator n=1 Tax=Falsiroseomonas oryzae TaxID=2766473 RepID=UPI0022EB0A18|nr:LysR family transcriptional regulator [Roseomonas sp. MO-31]
MRQVNLRGVDLNLLVLLDLLIEHRSVTAAAQAANMSQPAMSRALGRLRALLRDPLLARGSQGLVPTPAALALQPALKRLLGEAAELVARRRFDPASWRGQIGIAATDHQTILLLPRLMRRVSREAPLLEVKVVPFLASMLDELRDGRLGLTFGILEQALPPGLRREALYRDDFVTVLRAGHPALEDWSLERFVALEHVLVTVLGEGRGAIDSALRERGLARHVALRLPHFYAAMAVVAESDLVVTLPRSIAVGHAAALGLVALEPPLAPPPFTAAVIWPDVLDADPGNAWLRSLVREEARGIAGAMPL